MKREKEVIKYLTEDGYSGQRAKEEYPDDDVRTAINKYIKNRKLENYFYFDGDNNRHVYGRDIDYYFHKGYSGRKWEQKSISNGRLFMLRNPTLKNIDRPRWYEDRMVVAHQSEKRWRLPKSHNRHFSKFPQEIQDLIFEFALTTPKPNAICTSMVRCNWKRTFSEPSFDILVDGQPAPNVVGYKVVSKRADKDGPYDVTYKILRALMDASCLRVCKKINEVGSKMLYGKNTFHFNMTKVSVESCPPSLVDDEIVDPDPEQPSYRAAKAQILPQAIADVRNQVYPRELHGWVYYDQFLRFLHAIGPKNAALLKSLQFSGTVKFHECWMYEDCWRRCVQDLASSLGLYIPFIVQLCPAVEKIEIWASKDVKYWNNPQPRKEGKPHDECEALRPILEEEIRQIESLAELKVLWDDGNQILEAQDTVEWIRERAVTRKRGEVRKELAEAAEAAKKRQQKQVEEAAKAVEAGQTRCAFCGEGHLWVYCYNLCSLCGDYGHFQRSCKKQQ
ncbi:hypothetical protein G7Y89_g4206 [Cudoniella acicularis]|uniref:CCHC-type domain-containing protein n=1 Tax=Cudoniella acicularis TaxID=354080 RepID=A0A8H4W4X4_9HELO|nr:hypothetical protein G7Y89_g4206 [Cudoniella acicularis]